MDAGVGLGHRHLGVDRQRGVVVDRAVGGEHAAVAVRGELVQTEVAHHHGGVAHLGDQVPDADVEDAVGVEAGRTGLVLAGVVGHAEQHQPADTRADRLVGGLAQRLPGVLDHAGQRADRPWLGQPFPEEERQHQLGRRHPGLFDETPKSRGASEPARSDVGIGHRSDP